MPPSPTGRADGRTPKRTAGLIFAVLLCLYTASYAGTFRSDDEHILAARAQSLALWGDLGQSQVYGNQRVQVLLAQGAAATEVEPLQAILGAVAYKTADWLDAGGAQLFLLISLFATAATAAVVFLTARELGFRREICVAVALLYALGTMAWPYATSGYRDPLAGLAWSLAFLGWSIVLTTEGEGAWRGWLFMVTGLGAGVLSKNTSFAALLSFGIVALLLIGLRPKSPGSFRRLGWGLAALLLALLAVGLLAASSQKWMARYSLPYLAFLLEHAMSSPWNQVVAGVIGPFVSPSRSIFIFSPPLILGAAGLMLWRRSKLWFAVPAVLSILLLAALQALFYRELWAGTFGWGLRYMLPALPLMAVLSAPLLQTGFDQEPVRYRWLLGGLVGASVIIQLSAVLGPWVQPYLAWQRAGLNPFQTRAAWQATFLAIPPQLSMLTQPETWSLAGIRLARAGSSVPLIFQVAALAGGLALLAVLLVPSRLARNVGTIAISISVLLAALLPVALVASLRTGDSFWGGDHPEYEEMKTWINRELRAGDIVLLENYASPLWGYALNHWDSDVRWYSLPYDIPADTQVPAVHNPALDWTTKLVEGRSMGASVWLITSTEAPNYAGSAPRAFLDAALGPGEIHTFRGLGETEAIRYRQ